MSNLDNYLKRVKEQSKQDAEKYKTVDHDLCMLCGAYGSDKRTLLIRTGYEMKEAVEELLDTKSVEELPEPIRGFYYLSMCKSCRASLLGHMRDWAIERRAMRGSPMDNDGNSEDEPPEKNIPVRIDGGIRMMTMDEYTAWREGRK